jgi:hypothetical protein
MHFNQMMTIDNDEGEVLQEIFNRQCALTGFSEWCSYEDEPSIIVEARRAKDITFYEATALKQGSQSSPDNFVSSAAEGEQSSRDESAEVSSQDSREETKVGEST